MSLNFIQELNRKGLRIFTINEARIIAKGIGLQEKYVPRLLSKLAAESVIFHITKGKYALFRDLMPGSPLHEYEIALMLVNDGAISYWSALSFYGFSDQVINKTYLLSFYSGNLSAPYSKIYSVEAKEYVVIKAKIENKWGITRKFIGELSFYITDIERTLLDGLTKPQYYGGLREVMHAFYLANTQINLDKLYNYAVQYCPIVVAKRLGFILKHMGIESEIIDNLRDIRAKTYQKLDPLGNRVGKYNKEWMLIENI